MGLEEVLQIISFPTQKHAKKPEVKDVSKPVLWFQKIDKPAWLKIIRPLKNSQISDFKNPCASNI